MALSTAAEAVPFVIDEHSVARVGGTRLTLAALLAVYKQGYSVEELVEEFPGAPACEIHSCVAYYLRHMAEVDDYLREQGERADALRERVERELPLSEDFKRRLAAAKAERDARVPR